MAQNWVGADLWVTEYITPVDVYAHGVSRVLAFRKTAFQEMYVVESESYGKALVLDGKWQSCTGDEFLYHEPLVHPAAVHHGAPRQVLILGGGEGATTREVLRWQTVEKVVMVDIDGEVVEACRQHLSEMHGGSFDDPRFELKVGDALEYLDETAEDWDLVISDLTDPIEEGPSFRLFTKEYFERVRNVLTPDGIFVLQAGSVAPANLPIYARLAHTLQAVYRHVQPYTTYASTYGAPWGFLLASDRPLPTTVDPQAVDRRLQEKVTGPLKMFDGTTMLGLLHPPAHIRRAIAAETEVYTEAHPPKFFGKGILGQ